MTELNTLDEQIRAKILTILRNPTKGEWSRETTAEKIRLQKADELVALFTEHSKQARIDEWQTILKARISHGGNPAPFNPEGLSISTSNTEQMTELLHQFAQDRLTQLKRNK